MDPEEVERVVGSISEKDVMSFARRKLWDQDVAVSAVGSIEGLLDYNRYVHLTLISSRSYQFLYPSLNTFWEQMSVAIKVPNAKFMRRIRNDMSRNV